jgi:carboxymethylenebutenolidase
MREAKVNVSTPDGIANSFLYTPADPASKDAGPWPGIVYLTDIWGIRPATRKMAARVAEQGYVVLLPNLFYRTHKEPVDPLLKGGQRGMDVAGPLLASMTPARMVTDDLAYIDYLVGREDVTKPKVAVVGYCFSGGMAVRAAAAAPDKVAAAASFHGGRLVSDQPDSPHTLIPKIKAELYFGHAVNDQSATPQQIAKLDEVLKGWGGKYQSEIYEGAQHGWTVSDHNYNAAQSERHFEKLFDLLKRTLK